MRAQRPCSSSARRMERGETLNRLRSAWIAFGVVNRSTRAATPMLMRSSTVNLRGRPARGLSSSDPSLLNLRVHRRVVFCDTPTFAAISSGGCLSAASVTMAARPSSERGDCVAIAAGIRVPGIGSERDRLIGDPKTSGRVLVMSASGGRGAGAC